MPQRKKLMVGRMEDLNSEQSDEILNLKSNGQLSTVLLSIGHRKEEDKTPAMAKIRKPMDVLFNPTA